MNRINFNNKGYLELSAKGNAMSFATPFFDSVFDVPDMVRICDVGCSRKEWAYHAAYELIDISFDNGYHAMNLPKGAYDGIVSSHFLEHYEGRVLDVLEYWLHRLRSGGIIGLYLPNMDVQKYWAFGNKKHVHYLSPSILRGMCEQLEFKGLISDYEVTDGHDLNYSFYCVIEKI